MAKVRLSPMSEQDYEHFFETMVCEYAAENVQAGYWSAAGAAERSRKELLKVLSEGVRSKGHRLYTVHDDGSGQAIGHLWLKVEEDLGGRVGFIFAIYLEQEFRHRGFGKAIMKELDQEAGRLGLRVLTLHVFSANKVALGLYEGAGYQTRSLNMVREYPR